MNIAVVGCGYVAESYGLTLSNYPILQLVGSYDLDSDRLSAFCNRFSGRDYTSLEELLNDENVSLVLNLTNPRNHYDVTKQALAAAVYLVNTLPGYDGQDTLQIHRDAVGDGHRVIIADDLLATGGTARAVVDLVEQLGGVVAGLVFVVELEFLPGREKLTGYDVRSLIKYQS